MIKANIIADSISPANVRITTFVLVYPRFIHAEFMTHRMFSRNASSSRAIPVSKQIQMVVDNPAIPLAFTKNQKGMQGGEALTGDEHKKAVEVWLRAREWAVDYAKRLADLEVHKQYANRILEPWAHISVVCTATDYDNFFALRCHEAAQPEIHELADLMYDQYMTVRPTRLKAGEWHVPFATGEKCDSVSWDQVCQMSVARCARVSFLNHDGTKPDYKKDFELYQRLVGSTPIHASPAEHQAMAALDPNLRSGNLRGWVQYRKTLKNENIVDFTRPTPAQS